LLSTQLLGSLFTLSPGERYNKTSVKQLQDFIERTGRNFVSKFQLDALEACSGSVSFILEPEGAKLSERNF